MINQKSYIHIGWWMLNELHLSGSELIIYATIFSFTNGTDDHCFHGSANYLAERAGISRRGVEKVLKKLEEGGLIYRKEKVINNVKFIDYYTEFSGEEKSSRGWEEIDENTAQSSQDPRTKFPSYNSTYNSNISISNDIDNISYPPEKNLIPIKQKTHIAVVEETPLPGPLPEEVETFLKDSYEKYPSTRYQIDKQGSKYFFTTMKDLEKLDLEYGRENVRAVLRFIKQDDFRCKQIQSIGKLRKKNKDWIPYIVVIMDKMLQTKPKVIDLDNMQ